MGFFVVGRGVGLRVGFFVGCAVVGREVGSAEGFLVRVLLSPCSGQTKLLLLIFTLRLRLTPTLVSRMPKLPITLSGVMPTSLSQTLKVTDLTSSPLCPCVPICVQSSMGTRMFVIMIEMMILETGNNSTAY